ncbi:hypothetical protein Bca52824_051886 [Brassica carinata]|uniref:Uncharacterized protein n=1 Tax=Brassica carinata TaxID=52824 RepID=A0A8X7UK99_BRACI|nr:hypothetical protein Bca52824_051886 [Brassica carinata]
MLPAVTAITILLATSFPDFFNSLAPSAETISLPLMQEAEEEAPVATKKKEVEEEAPAVATKEEEAPAATSTSTVT